MRKEIAAILKGDIEAEEILDDVIVEEVALGQSDDGNEGDEFVAEGCKTKKEETDSDEEEDDAESEDEVSKPKGKKTDPEEVEEATKPVEDSEKEAEKDAKVTKKSAPAKAKAPAGKGAKGEEEDGEEDAEDDAKKIKASAPSKVTPPKGKVAGKMEGVEIEIDDEDDDDMEDDDDDMEESAGQIADSIVDSIMSTETPDVSEDISALVDGEETLTEEFKEKAAVIFEAAVTSKVKAEVESLKEAFTAEVETKVEAMHEALSDQLDAYLGYVVEEWIEKNDVALTAKLRIDIAEGFIASLKDVFVEHYIEMPEGKEDMFDDVSAQLDEATEAVQDSASTIAELTEELEALKREKILKEAAEGLAITQSSKLKSLVADVEFVSEESFAKKVATIKESYFANKKAVVESDVKEDSRSVVTTIVEDVEEESEIDPTMARYLKASSRLAKEAL